MDRTQTSRGAGREPWLVDEDVDGGADAAVRRQAAAWLREARLSDDPSEREALRRRAAELLAPSRRARGTATREPR